MFCCSVKVVLHGLGRFATTIFNATQRRSIETMLQLFETMSPVSYTHLTLPTIYSV